jgi:hypothetical protein
MPKGKEKVRPVHEIRLGRIKAAVWENETQNGIMHNVTFSRLYKDGKNWRDSSSFGRDDLPLLSKVADRVHTWLFEKNQDQNGSSKESNDSANGSNGSSHEEF